MKILEAGKREGKRYLLSLIHHVRAKEERIRVGGALKNYSAESITNPKPEKKKTVLFLVTRMVRFHGGQTSVLRLGTELSKLGFSIGYAVYKPQSRQEMALCAASNLEGYRGKLFTRGELREMIDGRRKAADIVVASSWDTVFWAKRLPGYKMYFVQDYEPYFYPFGELYLLARSTYEQGLHMVSLGHWNKKMIERESHPVSLVDVIDFPCEKREYPFCKRDFSSYAAKKKLVLAVYLKYYGKRLPCIIPHMLMDAAKRLKKQGIFLEVRYFGEAGNFRSPGGKNLGMLSKKELCKLYYEADFGMVASMTNISLVPFEMLSAGLPLIEFEEGTFGEFFPKESATFVGFSGKELAEKLLALLAAPEQLEGQLAAAGEYMEDLGWEKSAAQFAQIIKEIS